MAHANGAASADPSVAETLQRVRTPDFIIAGAMKSGTTTLHHLLASDERVFIPPSEIHYFVIDDLAILPELHIPGPGAWHSPKFEDLAEWYGGFFATARPDQIVGEDSATYFASPRAAERIAHLLPETRVVVSLRDPASRAYSHYWHLVRTGRCGTSFENLLQYQPHWVLDWSVYEPKIAHLQACLGDRLLVVTTEELSADPQAVVDDVAEFVGLGRGTVDVEAVQAHRGHATVPRMLPVQLLKNRLLRSHARAVYRDHVAPRFGALGGGPWQITRALGKLHRLANPLVKRRPPPMRPETRAHLDRYFRVENAGLAERIGKDLDALWYRTQDAP